ncbi:MAG: GerMN domain-containing protein [Desulfuromonadales bacterium]|nr:GerMN domain-containing protein [Desulfuromonadales bacterium]NIS43438.1 GerMN domain-containing protein [Desulfuromonadales bacterium]
MKKLNKMHIALAMAALLLVVAIAAFMLGRRSQPVEEANLPVEEDVNGKPQTRELSLYFAAEGESVLMPEQRDIPQCEDDVDCLRSTVEALIAGPQTALMPVLPARTSLLSVSEEDGLAVLDFDRSFVDLHPGGSTSELLTVYALIDTLAVNFPHVRKLSILVGGEPVETIKGHVDLRQPLTADFSYTRLPEGSESRTGTLPEDLAAGEDAGE